MYKIGELSRLCRLSVKTLRYYAEEGLLMPDEVDRFTGYRYYSASKLAVCNRIAALKELGFSLDEIRRHLTADNSEDTLALIEAKHHELSELVTKTEAQLRRLEAVKQSITEGDRKMYDMVIRGSERIRVVYVRKIFDSRKEAHSLLKEMRKALPQAIIGRRELIINYETEWRERGFDLAVCVEITAKPPQSCIYPERVIPHHDDTASLICRAEELEAAHTEMVKQLYELPAQIVGAFYEYYHEDGTVELKVPVVRLSTEEDRSSKDEPLGEFTNDPDVIGRWELVDIVPSREQFLPDSQKYGDLGNVLFKKLYFLPQGEGYWFINGWTKGYIRTKNRYTNVYELENVGGETYMFLHLKTRGSYSRQGRPSVYVYRKCDGAEYQRSDIRIYDRVDYPFIPDDSVIGRWIAYDCVRSELAECYDPSKRECTEDFFFSSAEFRSDGSASVVYGERALELSWIKGLLLHKDTQTAEAYDIREIDGHEYLMIEWKSGDYLYSGKVVGVYIFVRA